jgi:phospholipid/cholesterol/gamma-HCH transport system substrate-binding protein
MPRTRSLAWSELKIGIVSIVAIFMAALLIFLLSGDSGFFWQRYQLKAVFDNIAGLKTGAPVRIAGVEEGSVTAVEFAGDRVEVTMELSKERQPLVTTESLASLGSISLLGEAAVDITAASKGTPIPEFGYIKTGKAVGSIADVATTASTSLEAASKLIEDISNGRGTMGRLFTDEALYVELNRFVTSAEAVVQNINRGRGTMGRLMTDPTLSRSLEASVANLENMTGRLKAGEGTLGQLLTNDALSKSLTSTTSNLDTLTGRLNKGEGTMGQLITNDSLFKRLDSMSNRIDTLVGQLNAGEGTAGQLLHDKQLYENMNGTVTELKNLITEIKKDPKKYLNVKVSLF